MLLRGGKVIFAYYIIFGIILIWFVKKFVIDIRMGIIIGIIFTTFTIAAIPWHIIPLSATMVQIFFVILAILYHFLIIKKINKKFITNSYQNKLLLFLILLVLFLFISDSFEYGLNKMVYFSVQSLIPIMALGLFLPLKKQEIKAIFFTIVIGSLIAIINLFAFSDINLNRAVIIGTSSLVTARTISLGTILLLVFLLTGARKIPAMNILICLIAIFIGIYSILLTGSRGSILALLFTLISIIILQKNIILRIKGLTTFFFIAIASITILLVVPADMISYGGIDRIINFTETSDASDIKRFEKFKLAWDGIRKSKGLGIGTGGFDSLSTTLWDYPHNIFLEVALEQGILGLVLLLSILITSLRRTMKVLKLFHSNYYVCSLASLWLLGLANALVSGDIGKNILWITLGILWALPNKVEKPQS